MIKKKQLFAGVLLAFSWLLSSVPVWSFAADAELPKATDAKQTAAAAAAAEGPDYIIGPGDVIQIFVWRNPELTTSVPVRPDGKISTPLVEDVLATGRTPTELARDIEARLAEYIRSPQVSVLVTNPQSNYSKITIVGNVTRPGTIPYRRGMTLLDAIVQVGGLSQFAAGNRGKLVRQSKSGETVETAVRIERLLKRGKLQENVLLEPGDLIIVPESRF